ncbi:MAG: DedA family protein [Spirochaetes bacterium]|nr:DedA family protein [Spirochaetota bacterium]
MSIEQQAVKKKNIVRRLYDWVLHWADTKYSTAALALNAFAESSFFPIPPDVLLIALDLGKPKKSFYFAFICSLFSVIGGVAGYYIGYALWDVVGKPIIDFYNMAPMFEKLFSTFAKYSFWAVLIAAITPIPYKVFTITAGMVAASAGPSGKMIVGDHTAYFLTFMTASVIGRSLRFFTVSLLIYLFGEKIKSFIDRYFNWLSLLFVIVLAGGFVLIKYVF